MDGTKDYLRERIRQRVRSYQGKAEGGNPGESKAVSEQTHTEAPRPRVNGNSGPGPGLRRCWHFMDWSSLGPTERAAVVNDMLGRGWLMHSVTNTRGGFYIDLPASQGTMATLGRELLENDPTGKRLVQGLIDEGYEFVPLGDKGVLASMEALTPKLIAYFETMPEAVNDMFGVLSIDAKPWGIAKERALDPMTVHDNVEWFRKELKRLLGLYS